MKILITGNKGFIAKHLQRYLHDKGHEVIGFDFLNQRRYPNVDLVFHFAAMNGTDGFYERPFDVEYNDIEITMEVLGHYANTDTKIVFASSSELYNDAFSMGLIETPFHEESPVVFKNIRNPRWSYAIPKLVGETLLSNAQQQYGTNATVLRYFNVYGPGQTGHFIPDFIERAKNDEFYILGNDKRSFLYIDDAIQITVDLVISEKRNSYLTYNIGNPFVSYYPYHVAREILDAMGKEGEVEVRIPDGREGSPKARLPDTTRINYHIEQLTPIRAGIRKTVEAS